MKHTKAVTQKPAQAQSAYASKLQFKQEASDIWTQGLINVGDGIITLASGIFVNALGLGGYIIFDTDQNS